MITASLIVDEKDRSLSLEVKGHAGQAEIGKDIICASASILLYTVAQEVMDMTRKGEVLSVTNINEGDSTVSCKCKTEEAYSEAIRVFYFGMVGYQLLAHNYPQFVEYKIVGEVE